MKPLAKRTSFFQSAIFSELATRKEQLIASDRQMFDLGIGSPDLAPPPSVVQALQNALHLRRAFGYSDTKGSVAFRSQAAQYLAHRYGVSVSAQTEVLSLMGAQDGLSHLPLALVDPGDVVLIPDPGYPIYEVSVHLAGGIPIRMPCLEENNFLPDLQAIDENIAKKAKLMVLNYPGNPLATLAPASFFEQVIEFAARHQIVVIHDAAYIELVFGSTPAPSFLAFPGAKDVGIELHSFSKTFNMAGARIAFAAGNHEVLRALHLIKSNVDYGVFSAVQEAAIAALADDTDHIDVMKRVYQKRRDAFLAPLHKAGWHVREPEATMFVWAKIPTKESSREFAYRLMDEANVVGVPGVAFGPLGEGYVRFALVQPDEYLIEAASSIARILA